MDAVTYPTPEVVDFLSTRFVCFTVNTKALSPEGRRLLQRYRLFWEPGLVVVDHHQRELRRFVGYRAPDDFLSELAIALGKLALMRRQLADASDHFRSVRETSPELAAEALYWAGIAAYRRDGQLETLAAVWGELEKRFPESVWRRSADVLDFIPTGVRVS